MVKRTPLKDRRPIGAMGGEYAQQRQSSRAIFFRYRARARVVVDCARRWLPDRGGLQVMDLGSADGTTLLEIDRLLPGGAYLGLEYSAELLEQGRDLPENIRLRRCDINHIPSSLRQGAFDMVTALAVLEHLAQPQNAVEQGAQALKPGGVFVATTPHPFWDRLATRLRLLDDHHESHIAMGDLERMMAAAGLNVVQRTRFMWAPIAFMPYLGLPVSPRWSMLADDLVRRLRLFNALFINQLVVGRRRRSDGGGVG